MADLIDFLVEKQEQLGMSETQFQKFLGLPELSTWTRYKARQRPVNLRMMQLAASRFPLEEETIFRAAKNSRVRIRVNREEVAAS